MREVKGRRVQPVSASWEKAEQGWEKEGVGAGGSYGGLVVLDVGKHLEQWKTEISTIISYG